jgi:hypothetical protein
MADNSVNHYFSAPFERLLANPAQHPNPADLAQQAECESDCILEEIKAISDVLWLADQNQDSQFNEGDIAYTCRVIRRLVELKQSLDSLAFRAGEAAKPHPQALRAAAG